MSDVSKIFAALKTQGKMIFPDKTSLEQISLFEERNGIKLPSQYKEWLQMSDGGDLFLPAGVQLYGVSHKPLIDIKDDNKPNDNYVVIGALASGDPIVYEKGCEKICIYNQEAGRIESDEIYANFISFLNDLRAILGVED